MSAKFIEDSGNYSKYVQDDEDMEEDDDHLAQKPARSRINPTRELLDSVLTTEDDSNALEEHRMSSGSGLVNTKIADRESEVSLFFTQNFRPILAFATWGH